MGSDVMNRSRFERSPITQLLLEKVLGMEPCEIITYGELSELAGGDVQKEIYHLLLSARKAALKEHGVPTDAVTSVGIKRLDDEGAVDMAVGIVRHVNRSSHTTLRVLSTVKGEKLSNPQRLREFEVLQIQAGVVHLFSAREQTKRLLGHAGKVLALPKPQEIVEQSLRAFKDSG